MSSYKYPYNWSSEVVLRFYEKQTRATDLVAKIAGTSVHVILADMTRMLMRDNQVQFIALKKLIKQFQGQSWHDYSKLSVEQRRKYLTIVKWFAQDEAMSELDEKKVLDSHPYLPDSS